MALDPTDPPNVKFHWAAQMSGQPLRQIARYLGVTPDDVRQIYAGDLVPQGDTRLRIRRFAMSLGIDIPVLEWLQIRSQILQELEEQISKKPTPTPRQSRKPRTPKGS